MPSQIKKFPGYFLCSGSLLFFSYIFFLLSLLLVFLVLQFLLFTSTHCPGYFCFHHYYLVLFSCTSNITTAFMLASRHPELEINIEYYCTLYNTLHTHTHTHTHTHNMSSKRSFGQKDHVYVCIYIYIYTHTHIYTQLSGEALQIAVKRRKVESKGEKERYMYLNAEFQRIARRDKKAFLSNQ